MDLKNEIAIFMYAVVIGVVFFIIGCFTDGFVNGLSLGIKFFVIYAAYGVYRAFKAGTHKTKLDKMMNESVNDEIREMAICHITKRYPKLKKKEAATFINDLNNSDYTLYTRKIIGKGTDYEGQDAGYSHWVRLEDKDGWYHVSSSMASDCQVGDTVHILKTPSSVAKVIKKNDSYINLITSFFVTEEKNG